MSYQRYDLSRLCDETMRQLFIVFDQVAYVDITVISLKKRILS